MSGHRGLGERSAQAVIEASPDAILLVDTDGRIAYANTRVTDLFGYDPDELVGESIEVLVPESRRGDHVAQRDAYLRNPETRPMGAGLELSAQRSDGSTIPVDVSLSPIENDDGAEVMAVVRDVSDREILRAKYQTILEAVPDAVVVADATTGAIVETNERVTDLLGYGPDELIGAAQTALHPTGEEERYRELFEQHVAAEQFIFTQFPDGSDISVETSDGEHVPVEINARIFELGDRELIAGAFRDITTRKDREQALERLHIASRDLMSATSAEDIAAIAAETATRVLDLPMNGVHLYDPEADALVPVAWSDASRSVFGGEPPAIPAGEGLAWRVYETGDPEIHADVRETDHAMNADSPFVSELLLPLGEHGVLLVSSTVPDDFDATDEGLARILAANVEAALDRVDREQALRGQNERLDEFASIVSHDLRNPLNVAEGRLDLARRECESEQLAHVARAHGRMEALIDDLLTLARHGNAVDDTEPVDLRAIVGNCWETVDTAEATLDIDADRVVRADESRLRQLLENLVRNAVEHGGENVTVTIGDLEDGFYVADDGPGISGEHEQVFEAGYSTTDDGTGLGLSIVEQIAEAHGWTVSITEATSGGARFEVTGVEFGER